MVQTYIDMQRLNHNGYRCCYVVVVVVVVVVVLLLVLLVVFHFLFAMNNYSSDK